MYVVYRMQSKNQIIGIYLTTQPSYDEIAASLNFSQRRPMMVRFIAIAVLMLSGCMKHEEGTSEELSQLRTQVQELDERVKALSSLVQEDKVLAEIVNAECPEGAKLYASFVKREPVEGDKQKALCEALSQDMFNGNQACNRYYLACVNTLCIDMGNKAPQLGCSHLTYEMPPEGYGILRPPLYVSTVHN